MHKIARNLNFHSVTKIPSFAFWLWNRTTDLESECASEIQHIFHIMVLNLVPLKFTYLSLHRPKLWPCLRNFTYLPYHWPKLATDLCASEILHFCHITVLYFMPLKFHISPISQTWTLTVPLIFHISCISLTWTLSVPLKVYISAISQSWTLCLWNFTYLPYHSSKYSVTSKQK